MWYVDIYILGNPCLNNHLKLDVLNLELIILFETDDHSSLTSECSCSWLAAFIAMAMSDLSPPKSPSQ